MNELIKELAVQAGATFSKGYIELSDGQLMLSDKADVDHANMDLEKFAELIVRECADLVDRAISDGGIDGRVVKEHFGVEE